MRFLHQLSIIAWTGSIVLAQDSSPGAPIHEGQPSNCNGWHTVVKDEDCRTVPAKFGITFDQFIEWNPAISRDCLTNFWLGQAYCVRIGDKPTNPTPPKTTTTTTTTTTKTTPPPNTDPYSTRHPTSTFSITTTSIDKAWPPQKTKAGQPANCVAWHLVGPADTCEQIAVRYSIRENDVIQWNPDVGDKCDGLVADWWVCVGLAPQGKGAKFEWSTEPPDFTPPAQPTEHSRTVRPTADSSFVPSPSQGPMPTSCKGYHLARDGQTCREIVAQYGLFTEQQFLSWNPALNGNCDGLWANNYYCVANFDDRLPLPSHVTTVPVRLPSGSPRDCRAWYETTGGDDCAVIAEMFGTFTEKDFISWNPSVLDTCDGIKDGVWYCVAKADTPKTRTAGNPSATAPPTSRPTQSGVTNACVDWWLVGPQDTCERIRKENGISQAQLTAWNPAINAECQGLEVNKYICVGSSDPSAPPGDGPVTVPQPSREGMASDCRRFYMPPAGEFCFDMATKNGVSVDDFYKWNPAVGKDCGSLWPGYYYCVGVSGPVTTIGKRSIAAPTS